MSTVSLTGERRSRRSRSPSAFDGRWVPAAVVLLAPLVGVLVLRAPLFNNLPYRDPWFYPGYGWSLAHHVEIFGWFYYGVRFPAVLPTGWVTDGLGAVPGYLILRYVLLVGAGAALYACVRRFSTRATAIAAVLLLALNPFFLRLVLWDYTTFVAVPFAITGVALWLMAADRARWLPGTVAAGGLFAGMVFANPSFITLLLSLGVIDAVASVRGGMRGVGHLVLRGLAGLAGGITLFLLGWLAYRAQLGDLAVRQMIQPTIDFVREDGASVESFKRPPSEWLAGEPKIWAPVVLALATLVALGREALGTSLRARLAQFSAVYVGALWLYRFVGNWAAVETWWAYTTTAASMAFLMPLLLDAVARRRGEAWVGRPAWTLLAAAAVGAVAVVDLMVRGFDDHFTGPYDTLRDSPALLALVGLVGVAAGVVLRRAESPRVGLPAAAVLAAIVAGLALAPARYIGIGQTGEFVAFARADLRSYEAAYELNAFLEGRDQPHRRVRLWSPMTGAAMVAWTNLPHQSGGITDAEVTAPLGELTPAARDLVTHPNTAALLVLSEDLADVERAGVGLRAQRIPYTLTERGTWADGTLHWALLDLERPR